MSLCATTLLFGGAMVPSASASNQQQNGLVNVMVGDVTITDAVDVNVAAAVAANVCGVQVGPVAVLASQVDQTGTQATVCQSAAGPVTIVNN